MTIVWTHDDLRFLKSLRIAPGDPPFKRGRAFIASEGHHAPPGRESRPIVYDIAIGTADLEPAYVRAMVDPDSDRNTDGHPFFSIAYFRLSPVAVRANAIDAASRAIERKDQCKCGARVPHFACYA